MASDSSTWPEIGIGDPNVLVWALGDLSQFAILMYTGDARLPEYHLYTDNIARNAMKWVYPSVVRPMAALELQHCYPLGNGDGFIRRGHHTLRDPSAAHQLGTIDQIYKEWSDVVILRRQNDDFVPTVVGEDALNQEFNLESGSRFLGMLDNVVFYWNRTNESTIVGRSAKDARLYRWKVDGAYFVWGVLRGREKRYEFVVHREIRGSRNATGEMTVVEVDKKDATMESIPNVVESAK
jgi:hypothetical protein